MKLIKAKDTTDNLCKYCRNSIATCNKGHLKFGDGLGNDNVIECSEFDVVRWYSNYPKGKPEEFVSLDIVNKLEFFDL